MINICTRIGVPRMTSIYARATPDRRRLLESLNREINRPSTDPMNTVKWPGPRY
jgi:hypothetical protein